MRRFTRTPYYTGKDDPERGEVRGTLKLGETVIIEFNFVSDSSADAFSGLTIDNVSVSAN